MRIRSARLRRMVIWSEASTNTECSVASSGCSVKYLASIRFRDGLPAVRLLGSTILRKSPTAVSVSTCREVRRSAGLTARASDGGLDGEASSPENLTMAVVDGVLLSRRAEGEGRPVTADKAHYRKSFLLLRIWVDGDGGIEFSYTPLCKVRRLWHQVLDVFQERHPSLGSGPPGFCGSGTTPP